MQKSLSYNQKAQILATDGYDETQYHGAISPPIFQTAMFSFGKKSSREYRYTATNNPTFSIVSKKLAAAESGEACRLFATGMAAINAVFLSFLKSGDHIVVSENVYSGVKTSLRNFEKFGVEYTYVSGAADEIEQAVRPETRMIYVESPGSKLFDVLDIEAIGKIGRRLNIMTVIDNTWATPMFQNPLLYGFDLVIHSATKYLGGHSDIMGGAVIGAEKIVSGIHNLGAAMDPHQAWLLNRSLATLPMRMKHFMENTSIIASFLEAHPKIQKVLYPGLPSHPNYEIGRRFMSGYSSLLSFITAGDYEQSRQVMERLKIIRKAWSYGGPTSLAFHYGKEFRRSLERLGYPPNLIRLHVGFEDPDAIMEELDYALQAIT